MKITFLCTTLEPGRDGVGDYTRLLAEACTQAGHTCTLLSVNDCFVHSPTEETQSARQQPLLTLRLPASHGWSSRTSAAQRALSRLAPDLLSWQLVPYGFHPKGIIPPEVLAFAETVARGRRNHALLHELWIGLSRGEPLKNTFFYGPLQRRALLRLLAAIKPVALHTTNLPYQQTLARHDYTADLLPLFGNIPVAENPSPITSHPSPDKTALHAVLFGTIHPQFTAANLAPLQSLAQQLNRPLHLTTLGRIGAHGEALLRQLPADTTRHLGPLPPEEISAALQAADLGLATHPWALIGKSGAVAAYLDHGLPVVVPRDDWQLRRSPAPLVAIDPLVAKLSDLNAASFQHLLAQRQPPRERLPQITAQLLKSLSDISVD